MHLAARLALLLMLLAHLGGPLVVGGPPGLDGLSVLGACVLGNVWLVLSLGLGSFCVLGSGCVLGGFIFVCHVMAPLVN